MRRMSETFREVEAKMQQAEKRMKSAMYKIDQQQKEMMKKVEELVIADTLKNRFCEGDPVKGYAWTHERSFGIRYCFTSNRLIYPGQKAYRGEIRPDAPMEDVMLPAEIWLTKEEFTWRRIKGQI